MPVPPGFSSPIRAGKERTAPPRRGIMETEKAGRKKGMDWVDSLNAAIAYIEDHLTEEIDYGELAKIACCSEIGRASCRERVSWFV